MKHKEPVSRIMTQNVVVIKQNAKLPEADKLFKEHKIRHAPVVKNKKIVGMLSLTDLSRISFADNYDDNESIDDSIYSMLSVGQIMANNPVIVSSETIIKDVASLLINKEFHALPVVDNDQLVGIVTTTDLLKYLVDRC
ncbi:CBS domain-containing protein [Aureibaculum algae]|uniref:CBS domain-containing protein n=1 Tax=Aureibaculum algae TaxID=2584122 RepID=A0A5B7TMZ4_9FLAO|nr:MULTISPECIES: CBS domain-containing protein [Aureibaculum]QCX37688.1 CBS domain-containing protein [Aureibaculum algae]